MAKCVILVGPPGSGKSTLAAKLEKEGFVRISQDAQGKAGHQELFRNSLYEGKDVVVDRMNFNKQQRRDYLTEAKNHGYVTAISVIHEPFEVCFARALARENHETIKDEKAARSALELFFKNYERPTEDEADSILFSYPDGPKPNAIICDLDGTLADCEHRRHFVRRTDGQKKDWVGFFKGMSDDKVIEPVAKILEKFREINDFAPVWELFDIVLCSGRPDDYKKLTEQWLRKHGILYDALFMRRRHDSRQDDIVKEIILDFEILTRYTPFMILDDRDQVVKMWRRRGFQCLQVAEGDF